MNTNDLFLNIDDVCEHSFYDKENDCCFECGLVFQNFNFEDNLDENTASHSYIDNSLYCTIQEKKPQIGVSKYNKKLFDISQLEHADASTVDITSNTSTKKSSFIITEPEFYTPNLLKKFEYIKNKEYNFKENNFKNFYSIYNKIIVEENNFECIIGCKFYLNNEKKLNYSKPCYIFTDENELKKHLSKKEIIEKLKDVNFLKMVYNFYCDNIESVRKKNKSKTHIECFVVCVLLHHFLFHASERERPKSERERPKSEHERPKSERERPKSEHERPENKKEKFSTEYKTKLIKKCFGLDIDSNEVDGDSDKVFVYKKKKLRSYIFCLIDLFKINEVTMKLHIEDILKLIELK